MGHRLAWAVICGTAGLVVLFFAWILLGIGGDAAVEAVDYIGPAVLAAVCVPFVVGRALTETTGHGRVGWWLLAACLGSLGLSSAIFSYYPYVLHVDVPALSLVDLTDQFGSALTIPAMLVLVGQMVPASRLRLYLDGGVIVGTIFLISWVTVFHAIYANARLTSLDGVASVIHPILDVISVSVVVGAICNALRVTPSLLLVGLAIVAFASADTVFNLLAGLGMYSNGPNPADAGYPAGFVLVAVASRIRDAPGPVPERRLPSRLQVVMPYLPVVVATPILLGRAAAGLAPDAVTQIVLAAIVVLIVIRQLMVVVDSRALAASLDRTVDALAIALEQAREISAQREMLIERAPVGVCHLDADLRILDANVAIQRMTGQPRDAMVGRPVIELVDAADRRRVQPLYRDLVKGRIDHLQTEHRLLRADRTAMWCSEITGRLPVSPRGAPEFISIVEDVTSRREQAQRAVDVQRQLLPQSPPRIAGYEIDGACLPAEDVSGDFYDWFVLPDGAVDVVVADVMGKGVGAALIMAVLRTALRSSAPDLGPAARVRIAADSIAVGVTEDGLFVTLFYARLDPASGRLRYVDAGHGYCGIRRPGGEIVRLAERSLPVGVRRDEEFAEGEAWLEPGDALVIHSDGLVESEVRTQTLDEFEPEFRASRDAAEMVRRLIATVSGRRSDDVTVAVIRRRLDNQGAETAGRVRHGREARAAGPIVAEDHGWGAPVAGSCAQGLDSRPRRRGTASG
jgi:PAS domain S-box-containing protein